jgi:hypothetical protein
VSRTFAQLLADREVTPAYYVTVDGLPFVFADFAKPDHWTIPVEMTWKRSLVPFRLNSSGMDSALRTVSEELDWRTGVTVSGNLDLEFLTDAEDPDDVWTNLVIPPVRNTWLMDGHTVHKPSATVWQMRSLISREGNTIKVGDIVHSGIGCAQVVDIDTGDNTIHVNINKFGSYFDWRGATGFQQNSPRGGDVKVTSWPSVWARRRVSVWMELCARDRQGARIAVSDSYKQPNGAGREIFRGVVLTAPILHPESPTLTLMCQDLTQPLSRTLVSRTRKYRPGPKARGMGSAYVEETGPCLVEFAIHSANRVFSTGPYTSDFPLTGVLNVYNRPIGMTRTLRGVCDGNQIAQAVIDALNEVTRDSEWTSGAGIRWRQTLGSPESTADGTGEGGELRQKWLFGVCRTGFGTNFGLQGEIVLKVKSAQEPDRAILRALGFEEDLVFGVNYEGIGEQAWSYAWASTAIPWFFWAPGNKRMPYWGPIIPNFECADPPLRQGTVDQDGHADGLYVRFGEHEVFECMARRDFPTNPLYYDGNTGDTYFEVTRRAVLGSQRAVVIPTDEVEDTRHELVIGLGFFNHDLNDVLKQLLVSNGDPATGGPWNGVVAQHNVLPQGFGAEIPAEDIHDASFTLAQLNGWQPKSYGMWIEQALTARDLLGEIAVATGVNYLSQWEGARRKLGAVKMEPPLGTRPVAVVDDSWVDDAAHPVEANYDELAIRNRIAFEYDFDPLQDKFHGIDNSYFDANSVANYGISDPLEIRVRWLSAAGDVVAQLAGVAAAIFRRFADPIVGYAITFAKPEGWLLTPADDVEVTKSGIPNYRDGGYGVTDVPMRVERIEPHFGPEKTFGKAHLTWFVNRVGIPWSPCVRLKEQVSGATYSTYRRGEAGSFTPYEDGREDVEFFAAGHLLIPYLPGADEKGSARTVISVDAAAGEITLDAVHGLATTDGVVLEPANFDLDLDDGGGDETLYSATGVTLGDDEGYSVVTATVDFAGGSGDEFGSPGQDVRTGTLRVTVTSAGPTDSANLAVFVEGVYDAGLSVANLHLLGDLTAGVSVLIEVADPWDVVLRQGGDGAVYTILVELVGGGGGETLYNVTEAISTDACWSVVLGVLDDWEPGNQQTVGVGQDTQTGTVRLTLTWSGPGMPHVELYLSGAYDSTDTAWTSGVGKEYVLTEPWDLIVAEYGFGDTFGILVELVGGGGGDETLYSRSEVLTEDASYSVVTDAIDVEVEGAWPTPGEDARTGTLRVTVTFSGADGYVSLELYLGGAYDSTIDITALSGVPQTIAVAAPWDLVVYNNGSSLAFTVLVELVGAQSLARQLAIAQRGTVFLCDTDGFNITADGTRYEGAKWG